MNSPQAPGQTPPDANQTRQTSATLPESNEAILLSGRVDDAVRASDFRLAIELAMQVLKLPEELVAAPGSRTYYPVWRHASRLLGQLPDAGLQLYRQLYDAEAAGQLAEALRSGDSARLMTLFRAYPQSTSWPDIGRELVARQLDEGDFAGAVGVLQELLAAGDQPDLRVQLAIASAGSGAWQTGARLLETLRSEPAIARQPRENQRLDQVEAWIKSARRGDDAEAAVEPHLAAGDAWLAPLGSSGGTADEIVDAIDTLRRLPLMEPAVAPDALVVRRAGEISAWDPLTLACLWRQTELRPEIVVTDITAFSGDHDMAPEAQISPSVRTLLTHYLRQAVSLGFGAAYSIEGVAPLGSYDSLPRRPFQILPQVSGRTEVVARELTNGSIRWRTGIEDAHPLAGAAIQDRPLPLDSHLVVPYSRNSELHLAALDPDTGKLIQDVTLVGPPLVYYNEGGRCLLAADETSIYVATGNGVVAAVARRDLTWQWACTYPSSLTQHLSNNWWQPAARPAESGVDRPLIADNLLVVAPMDSNDIFAIDRFSGRERWRMPRRETVGIVGAVDAGLVLVGNGLSCLDLGDPEGRPARWRTVSLDISGRPTINGRRVYAPTRDGVIAVDAVTGKIVADESLAANKKTESADDDSMPHRVSCGNLFASRAALYSITGDRLVRLPDLRQTRETAQRLIEADPRSERGALALAWVEALSGNPAQALERLQTLKGENAQFAEARDRLMSEVFLALARSASEGKDRLSYLRQAAGVAQSPEVAARLSAIIGETLEREGRWADAIAHYGDALLRLDPRQTAEPGDTGLHAAEWLHATRRLAALQAKAPPPVVAAEFAAMISRFEAAPEGSTALQRLTLATEDRSLRQAIGLALIRLKLAPELLIQYLPEDDPAWPRADRRALALARWETHVALQMSPAAQDDQARWTAEFARDVTDQAIAKASEDRPQLEADRKLASRVASEQRKIADIGAVPFTAGRDLCHRRWRIEGAELIVDPRNPLRAVRSWLPIRARNEPELQLIESVSNQVVWRKTKDATEPVRSSEEVNRVLATSAQVGPNEARWTAWPAVFRDSGAVVPAAGGIVCIGTAPGRRVRERAWDLPLPAWSEIPRNVADRMADGPRGVYLAMRDDSVAMVGWADGRIWWRRDLPGMAIERVSCVQDRLIIVTQDQQVLSLDATYGDDPRRLPAEAPTAIHVELVGDFLVTATAEGLVGYDADTLEPKWSQPLHQVGEMRLVEGRSWIAARAPNGWTLLNAESGAYVFDRPLEGIETFDAIACDGTRLLVAARSHRRENADQPRGDLQVVAFDATSGAQLWKRQTATTVKVNVTQLLGHPDFIPLLLDRPRRVEQANQNEERPPIIEVLSRKDGSVATAFSISDSYRAFSAALCDMMLLVTPARLIVQVEGNIIAFGDPPQRREP
ncbi:MAG: PQQ-binding-like beta-propeller repeat protein [Planctomycetes bacterium]|nr:PQQ-binding-like beta-propeller repeat protein [Planctomycetota bacterium]